MSLTELIALPILTLSISANIGLFLARRRPTPQRADYTASELLKRLLQGGAVMEVKLIEPGSFFLRSPRDSA
jgi:hypothetical protein